MELTASITAIMAIVSFGFLAAIILRDDLALSFNRLLLV